LGSTQKKASANKDRHKEDRLKNSHWYCYLELLQQAEYRLD